MSQIQFVIIGRKVSFKNPFSVKSSTQIDNIPSVGWWLGLGKN